MRLFGWLALHHDQGRRTIHGKAIVPVHGTRHMEQSLLMHLRGNFEGNAVKAIDDVDTLLGYGLSCLVFHVDTPLEILLSTLVSGS